MIGDDGERGCLYSSMGMHNGAYCYAVFRLYQYGLESEEPLHG